MKLNQAGAKITVEQYKHALAELANNHSKLMQNGFAMLKANYRSPGRLISATRLSQAADEAYTGHGPANIQYGHFARQLAGILGYTPETAANGDTRWTYTLCTAHEHKDRDGHFQWILRPEVAEALERMGMVDPIRAHDTLDDLQAMEEVAHALSEKERVTYQKARIGQGPYRERLINYWGGCAVTGCQMYEVLIASHMKPWRDCNVPEAVDMPNGLLLVPNLDAAFDQGFITFEDNGQIRLSPQMKLFNAAQLGITEEMRLRKDLTQYHLPYLHHHRTTVFRSKP